MINKKYYSSQCYTYVTKKVCFYFLSVAKSLIYVAVAVVEQNGRIIATEKKGSNGLLNFARDNACVRIVA